jgi:hypothetical protein
VTLSMVASRNAGAHPFLHRTDSTSSSAASKSAWSSTLVKGRRAGRPSYSLACTAMFSGRQIWLGTEPNRVIHDAPQP